LDCKVAEKLFAICLLGLISTAQAAENENKTETESSLPDLEFLEFLGQFETDNGEWINPASLMTEEFELLLEAAIRAGQNENSNDNGNGNALGNDNEQRRNN
jgi:hypothetical protein